MLVGQDVDDLLDELGGGHVVPVFGRPDQVVAHLLLVPLLRGVLRTVGLWEKTPAGQPIKSLNPFRCRITNM